MDEGLGIIYIVCGIVSLIFFVKIWAMTNDVNKIKSIIVGKNEKYFGEDIRRAYLKGDKSAVEDLLIKNLVENLLNYRKYEGYTNVASIIDKHEPMFEKFGIKIPDNILKLKDDPSDIFNV